MTEGLRIVVADDEPAIVMAVRDELLFEGPAAEAAAASALVRERMEGAASLTVPLTVDVGIGENWKDAKP